MHTLTSHRILTVLDNVFPVMADQSPVRSEHSNKVLRESVATCPLIPLSCIPRIFILDRSCIGKDVDRKVLGEPMDRYLRFNKFNRAPEKLPYSYFKHVANYLHCEHIALRHQHKL